MDAARVTGRRSSGQAANSYRYASAERAQIKLPSLAEYEAKAESVIVDDGNEIIRPLTARIDSCSMAIPERYSLTALLRQHMTGKGTSWRFAYFAKGIFPTCWTLWHISVCIKLYICLDVGFSDIISLFFLFL